MSFRSKEGGEEKTPFLSIEMSVNQNLDVLRARIAPKSKLETYGPKKEMISYSFSYNSRLRWGEGLMRTKDILGVVIRQDNSLFIWNKRHSKNSFEHIDNVDPIQWTSLYDDFISTQRQMKESFEKVKRIPLNIFFGEAVSRYPGIPRGIGAEMARLDQEGGFLVQLAQKENIYKVGDLRGVTIVENINSAVGQQRYIDALAEFYRSMRLD